MRLGKAGDSFALHTFAPLLPADVDADPGAPGRIVDRTRREICRPRTEVEAGLREAEARIEAIRAQWQARQEAKKTGSKKAAEEGGESKSSQPKPPPAKPPKAQASKAEPVGVTQSRGEKAQPQAVSTDTSRNVEAGTGKVGTPKAGTPKAGTARAEQGQAPPKARAARQDTSREGRAPQTLPRRGEEEGRGKPEAASGTPDPGSPAAAATQPPPNAARSTQPPAQAPRPDETVTATKEPTAPPPASPSTPLFFGLPDEPFDPEGQPEKEDTSGLETGRTQPDAAPGESGETAPHQEETDHPAA